MTTPTVYCCKDTTIKSGTAKREKSVFISVDATTGAIKSCF